MPPVRFINIGVTSNSEHAAIACPEKKYFGLQFHPEVGRGSSSRTPPMTRAEQRGRSGPHS